MRAGVSASYDPISGGDGLEYFRDTSDAQHAYLLSLDHNPRADLLHSARALAESPQQSSSSLGRSERCVCRGSCGAWCSLRWEDCEDKTSGYQQIRPLEQLTSPYPATTGM